MHGCLFGSFAEPENPSHTGPVVWHCYIRDVTVKASPYHILSSDKDGGDCFVHGEHLHGLQGYILSNGIVREVTMQDTFWQHIFLEYCKVCIENVTHHESAQCGRHPKRGCSVSVDSFVFRFTITSKSHTGNGDERPRPIHVSIGHRVVLGMTWLVHCIQKQLSTCC